MSKGDFSSVSRRSLIISDMLESNKSTKRLAERITKREAKKSFIVHSRNHGELDHTLLEFDRLSRKC